MSRQFQGWPPTRIENDQVVIKGSYITPQQIKTSDYFLVLGGLSGCVIGWMAGEAAGFFFGEVVGAGLGTIILSIICRQSYLSFKTPFEVVFTEQLMRFRHGKGGWTDFDRKVAHSFDMELHERAAAEEHDDGVARSNPDPQKKGTVERIYRDSYHVFLVHVHGKFNFPDMHGKSNAQLLSNRLKGVDEYMKNFRPQEEKAEDPYAGRRSVGGKKEENAEVKEGEISIPETGGQGGKENSMNKPLAVVGIIIGAFSFIEFFVSSHPFAELKVEVEIILFNRDLVKNYSDALDATGQIRCVLGFLFVVFIFLWIKNNKGNSGPPKNLKKVLAVGGTVIVAFAFFQLFRFNSNPLPGLIIEIDLILFKQHLFNDFEHFWGVTHRTRSIIILLSVGFLFWHIKNNKSIAGPKTKRRILERIRLGHLFPYDNPWHALQLVCIILTVLILIIAGINIMPDLPGSMEDSAQKVIDDNPAWGDLSIYGGSLFLVLFVFIGFIFFSRNRKKSETVPPVTKPLPIPEVPPVATLSKRGLRPGSEDEEDPKQPPKWDRNYSNDDEFDSDVADEGEEEIEPEEEEKIEPKKKKEEKKPSFEKTMFENSIPEISYRKQGDPQNELDEMIGLESVKKQVKTLIAGIKHRERRKKLFMGGSKNKAYHMMFTGNPGSGKTTVARIMADILYDIGVVTKRGVLEVDRSNMVGPFTGHTEAILKLVIDKAQGRVLFIDEAYGLYRSKSGHDPDGELIVNHLNKALEDKRGKFVCILAGYKDEMEEFLKSNPGLKSRVPLKIHFPDYTLEETMLIFLKLCQDENYSLGPGAEKITKMAFAKILSTPGEMFANGRTVRNFFEQILEQQNERTAPEHISNEELMVIREEDIKAAAHDLGVIGDLGASKDEDLTAPNLRNAFDQMVGIEGVKNELEKIFFEQKHCTHMVFAGNPGTLKTALARVIGQVFAVKGILDNRNFIEIYPINDLEGYEGDNGGEYLGEQMVSLIEEKIREALGGILFFDDIHDLTEDTYGKFAEIGIDKLMSMMKEYEGQFMVILHGYPEKMERFLRAHPALASAFDRTINFPDIEPAALNKIFLAHCKMNGYQLMDAAKDKAEKNLNKIYDNRGEYFRNSRAVKYFYEQCAERAKARMKRSKSQKKLLHPEDIARPSDIISDIDD